jgi:Xaa-Pro aminopeptidase
VERVEGERRGRLDRAQRELARLGWSGLVVGPGADLRYLTGYDAMALERLTCLVLPCEGTPTMVVPRLERAAAHDSGAEAAGVRVVDHPDGTDGYLQVVDALGAAAATVGIGDQVWASHLLALQKILPQVRWQTAAKILGPLRARKTPTEVAALTEAAAAIDAVHLRMGQWLRPGRAEIDVADDIERAMRDTGHANVDFVIVAAGPNAASPHHHTSSRVIGPGDPVVVDIGGTMPSGYCSDCTRTYLAGDRAPDGFLDYYTVLQAAQRAAVTAVTPGVSAHSVDAAARNPITDAGYGPAFLHRTGHGIGLDTHEDPYIVAGNTEPLTDGMTFSIEPGIYLTGRHGARIEDIVACTDTGVRRLNTTSTNLLHL